MDNSRLEVRSSCCRPVQFEQRLPGTSDPLELHIGLACRSLATAAEKASEQHKS